MENHAATGLRPRRRELIEEEEYLSESNSSETANSMSDQRPVASTSTTGYKRQRRFLIDPPSLENQCNQVEDAEPSVKEQSLSLWKRAEMMMHLRKKAKELDGEFKASVTADLEKDVEEILKDAAKLAENVFKNSSPGNSGKGDCTNNVIIEDESNARSCMTNNIVELNLGSSGPDLSQIRPSYEICHEYTLGSFTSSKFMRRRTSRFL